MNTRSRVCISSDAEDCPGASPNSEERSDWNPGTSGPDSGPGASSTRGISGPDGGCPAGSDGIPHTSGPDGGPGTSSTRSISGPDEACLARHNGTSSLDEDNYSSYLTLVATISDDSSEDEGLQQAIIASMESHMWVVHTDYEFEKQGWFDHWYRLFSPYMMLWLEMHRSIGNRSQSADNTPIGFDRRSKNRPKQADQMTFQIHNITTNRRQGMHSHFADPGLLRGDSDSDKSAAEYRVRDSDSDKSAVEYRVRDSDSDKSAEYRVRDSDSDKSAAEYRGFWNGSPKRTVSVHLHAALVRYGGGPRTRRGS